MGVHDRIVDGMIDALEEGSLFEILRGLRVEAIYLYPLKENERFPRTQVRSCVGTVGKTALFARTIFPCAREMYQIGLWDADTLEEWTLTLGHELGHIFEDTIPYGRTLREYVRNRLWHIDREDIEARHRKGQQIREEVCDEFALAWLRMGNTYEEVWNLLYQNFIVEQRDNIFVARHT